MAKYDQGGGCACGIYKDCCCEWSNTKKPTDDVKLPLVTKRFADELIRICEDELDYAIKDTMYQSDLIAFIDGVKKNAT